MIRKRQIATVLAGCVAVAAVEVSGQIGTPINPDSANVLTVAVYGDSPYGTDPLDTSQTDATAAFIASINGDPKVDLVLHVGDIHSGKQYCTEAYDRTIYDLWTLFKDPLILIRSIFFSNPGYSLGGRKKQVVTQALVFDPAYPSDANYVENVMAARGRYVAFLDADDRWYPDFLDRQVSYLDDHPHCALVYADARIVGESALAGYRFMERTPSKGAVTLLSLVEQRCNVILSTVVARRTAIMSAGMFDEGLRSGQDFDLWLRLALKGATLEYQPIVLGERRVPRDGFSGGAVAELEHAMGVLQIALIVGAGLFLALYLGRRRSRLGAED